MSTTMFRDRSSPGSPFSGSDANDMNQILARNWWLIALRGFTGVIFGLSALILPFATLRAVVLLFSACMIVDGIFRSPPLFTPRAGMTAGGRWRCRASRASPQALSRASPQAL